MGIGSVNRYTSTSTSSSSRQPPPGAVQLENKLRSSGLSDDQVKSTMKTLFGDRGGSGGGTLDGTEAAGSQAFALKLQSALMSAGVSDSDAQSVVSSVGSGRASSSSSTGTTDSYDAGSASTGRQAPAGAEQLEARLRAAGLSEDQIKATMKRLYGDKGGSGGGTLDGTEEAGSQAFALKLQSALMAAGVSNTDAQSAVSSVGSAGSASKWGYSGVSSFEY